MGLVIKYFCLPMIEKRLYVEALFYLLKYKIKLKLFSAESLFVKISNKTFGNFPLKSTNISFERIAAILNRASRLVPSTCLSKALAGQVLMSRNGYKTELHLGVAKNNVDSFEAHSWLTLDGKIVLCDLEDIEKFQELPINREECHK